MIVRLDFETRSPVDIRTQGAWLYSRHPDTEVLCLAYEYQGEAGLFVPDPFMPGGLDLPPSLYGAFLDGATFEAHNAFFEQVIWQHICVDRWGWPAIRLDQWRCTAAISSAHSLPRSLDGAASALGLIEQKDKEGHRVMLKLSKPRKPSKHNPATYFDGDKDFEKLYSYCKQDVQTQKGLSEDLAPLSPSELDVWRLDQTINRRGIRVDRDAVEGALLILHTYQQEVNRTLEALTGGEVGSIGEVARIKKYVNDLGDPIESLAKGHLTEVLATWDLDPVSRELLELRLAAGRSSVKKFQAMLRRMDSDDRVRELIVYHGAHSGRWAGRGIQVQNLPKGSIKDQDEIESAIDVIKTGSLEALRLSYSDPMDVLSSCLRGMLCAAPGHTLYCADYASIEARFLMWLAGETGAVAMFRDGADIYSSFASEIFGHPIEGDKDKRQLGKIGILGAGYQMGGAKFHKTCASWGLEISEALADKTIATYRKAYPRVKRLWYETERAAIKAVKHPGAIIQQGKIKYRVEGYLLYIRLPSGRKMAYYKPEIHEHVQFGKEQLTYMGISAPSYKWQRQSTYGGKIVENIVQGACRDVMAEAMINLEKEGYPIVLTVHDELVAEVPKKNAPPFSGFCETMSTVPTWAEGLPLAVEGWTGERFRK